MRLDRQLDHSCGPGGLPPQGFLGRQTLARKGENIAVSTCRETVARIMPKNRCF